MNNTEEEYIKECIDKIYGNISKTEKKEYPILVNQDWSTERNYWTLEAIKDDGTYTHNFNKLSIEMQNKIIQIYGHNLADHITVYEKDSTLEKIKKLSIKHDINKHRPSLN